MHPPVFFLHYTGPDLITFETLAFRMAIDHKVGVVHID